MPFCDTEFFAASRLALGRLHLSQRVVEVGASDTADLVQGLCRRVVLLSGGEGRLGRLDLQVELGVGNDGAVGGDPGVDLGRLEVGLGDLQRRDCDWVSSSLTTAAPASIQSPGLLTSLRTVPVVPAATELCTAAATVPATLFCTVSGPVLTTSA